VFARAAHDELILGHVRIVAECGALEQAFSRTATGRRPALLIRAALERVCLGDFGLAPSATIAAGAAAPSRMEGSEMRVSEPGATDQAGLPTFRALLGVQVLATIVFGMVPLLLPSVFASVTGYSGDDSLVYRLAGAATTGYLVAAILALTGRTPWVNLRIPMVATLTFTAAAALSCLVTLVGGDSHWVVLVVLLAATAFALIAIYWLRRDQGPVAPAGLPVSMPFRVVVGLASLSAATFGLLPLLAPGPFASLFGLAGTDTWIFRMAGSACLGYATAGVLSIRAEGYERFAVQNLAAVTFNTLGAAAAWKAVVYGEGGYLAPVVGLAATFFAVALMALAVRSHPRGSTERPPASA
jgi:hypothetical protein